MRGTQHAPESEAPHELWWTLLLERIEQVRPKLPADLFGTVQFEVDGGRDTTFLTLQLNGAKTEGRSGFVPRPDCWVATTEAELAQILETRGAVEGALRASGKVALLEQLLARLAELPPTTDFIGVRSGR